MALGTIKLIKKAVWHLLANPTAAIVGDANREEARQLFALYELPVYVGNRPQDSEDLAITVEGTGGPRFSAVDQPLIGAQTAIEISIWGRNDDDRQHIEDIETIAELIQVYLTGMSREVLGVDISDCYAEAEHSRLFIAPVDRSDNWTTRLSTVYLFTHDRTVASAVAV